MNTIDSRISQPISPNLRLFLQVVLLVLVFLILVGMASIPFVSRTFPPPEFRSTALWIRSLGKMCGILAGSLVLLQYVLSGRIRFLDRIFSLNRLLIWHRGVAVTAAIFATLHPLLLFGPEQFTIQEVAWSLWPLFLGPLMLIMLWTAVATGLYRVFLSIPFESWFRMHRIAVFSLVVLLGLHLFNVGSDFQAGWPKVVMVLLFSGYALFFLWNKVAYPILLRRKLYTVASVTRLGRDVNMIELRPRNHLIFRYLPGQFSFVRFFSAQVSSEEHHFTLSSTPTRAQSILFTVKCSGDFTSRLGALKPGNRAVLDGPYGLFSYPAHIHDREELILIAGGIGITPLLSMLRYMEDHGDTRKVTLIWSNRKKEDILLPDEFERFENRLSLTVHHVLTREEEYSGPKGHLDREMLGELLQNQDRGARVFVCGPPRMMDSVVKGMKALGFSWSRIHTERFKL